MNAIKTVKVRWSDIFDAPIVDNALCYLPGVHKIGQPIATVVIYFVIVNPHSLKSFNTEVSSSISPSRILKRALTPFLA